MYSARMTAAGSYSLRACIGAQTLPGWPQVVHVQPAASNASKCWLSGPALQVLRLDHTANMVSALVLMAWPVFEVHYRGILFGCCPC
jgi:hypothetical protein